MFFPSVALILSCSLNIQFCSTVNKTNKQTNKCSHEIRKSLHCFYLHFTQPDIVLSAYETNDPISVYSLYEI